jgi:predicted component of type VI protein secretion system
VRLIVEQGPGAGQSVALRGSTIVVGRGEGSDLTLSETGVSRQHARFHAGPKGWVVSDLDSTNGTFVNGQRLLSNQPYLLKPGDRIAIGSTVLLVHADEAEVAGPEEPVHQGSSAGKPRPAVLAVGAVALVAVLVGIVVLLVILLQPEAEPAMPTAAGPLDQIATAFPLPTGVQGVMTSVATMLPTGFPLLPLGSTPTPEAALPARQMARSPARPTAIAPVPEPPIQPEWEDAIP